MGQGDDSDIRSKLGRSRASAAAEDADIDLDLEAEAMAAAEQRRKDACSGIDNWGPRNQKPPTAEMKHRCDDHLEDVVC